MQTDDPKTETKTGTKTDENWYEAPSKIWNLKTPNAEPRALFRLLARNIFVTKKGEVKKLSRSLEKVWIVELNFGMCKGTQRIKTIIDFVFKKSIYDRFVLQKISLKILLLQKISEKILCSGDKYLEIFVFGVFT
jgi:hypothetical protein